MNWYVLYVLSPKVDQLIHNLNKRDNIKAFTPKCEYYRRKEKDYAIKPLFSGYIFVKSKLSQLEFNDLLLSMDYERDGIIRQLVNDGTTALSYEEIDMFNHLLDGYHVVRMSQAYLEHDKAIVYNGPLKYFENHIIKVDKHNQVAYLDLSFMKRQIKIGLTITGKE